MTIRRWLFWTVIVILFVLAVSLPALAIAANSTNGKTDSIKETAERIELASRLDACREQHRRPVDDATHDMLAAVGVLATLAVRSASSDVGESTPAQESLPTAGANVLTASDNMQTAVDVFNQQLDLSNSDPHAFLAGCP